MGVGGAGAPVDVFLVSRSQKDYIMMKYRDIHIVKSQKQLDVVLKCQFFKIFKIRVIFEILLSSIVCFLQFSSCYIQVRVIIKVMVFLQFYGIYTNKGLKE